MLLLHLGSWATYFLYSTWLSISGIYILLTWYDTILISFIVKRFDFALIRLDVYVMSSGLSVFETFSLLCVYLLYCNVCTICYISNFICFWNIYNVSWLYCSFSSTCLQLIDCSFYIHINTSSYNKFDSDWVWKGSFCANLIS